VDLEGTLRIGLVARAGRVERVRIASTRPDVAGLLLQGRRRSEIRATLPRLFSVCSHSQAAAGDLACAVAAGEAAGEVLLQDLPTAVFAANDLVAVALIDRLEQDGVRIPEDVSVIGYDNTFVAGLAHIQLTTINQPRRDMGADAFSLVMDRAAGRTERTSRVHKPTLVVRATTGPPP